jgi:hypothetical protein
MQAFTAQRLTHQTTDNPFTNTYLLATLIIPHLETYLAAHSEVRFLLLEFPPDHLATILALQKLVGVDLLKVAQIVDSNAKEPLPFTHVRGASISARKDDSSSSSGSGPQVKVLPITPSPTPENFSFSKANYLLTSTASESEISTFISTVWKILMEISQFYIPEETPKPKSARKIPSPITFSPFPKLLSGPQSPPLSPAPPTPSLRLPSAHATPARPVSPAPSSKAPSLAETVKTNKSGKSRKGGKSRKSPGKAGTPGNDGESTLDLDFADDSDYDMEERRLMPMFMRKPVVRKGNSRKALKFLGLA